MSKNKTRKIRTVAQKTGKSRRGAANLIYDKSTDFDVKMESMSVINDAMLELTGVPIGAALAPSYPFRNEWVEIANLLKQPQSPEMQALLEALVTEFRAITSSE